MKADGSLKSLLQGISQQPVRDRLPGQGTAQINMSADPVKGLSRRPGEDLVNQLGPAGAAKGWGTFQTQDGKQWIVKITASGPQVFDFNGNQATVTVPPGDTYWSTNGQWSVATMKGKTYLANSGVVVEQDSAVSAYPNYTTYTMAVFQILGGNYGKTYTIRINNAVAASFTTPDGSVSSHALQIDTVYIASQLAASLVSNGYNTGGWTTSRVEDIITVRHNVGVITSAIVSDGAGNINAKAMLDSVGDVADLPRFCYHNFAVRVAQEVDPEEDLWLKFVMDNPAGGLGTSGAWYECLAPGLSVGLKNTSMPRCLTYDATTGTFTAAVVDWADRNVGTNTTNPMPSFVGYPITDISMFQSRLIVLAGPNLIASRSKRYEDFFVGSASTLVDSDPLDLTSQAAFASTLKYAIPHNKDLVIFSTKGQFILFGRSAITPSNAALVLTTSFEADLMARPQACGRNVFFATKYGRFAGVREFYTEGGTDINDTRSITQHVNKYMVGSTVHMSATSNYDHLLVHTDNDRKNVYVYQFIWNDQEKIQSAWSKWQFSHEIVYSFFDDELIYLIMQIGTTYYLLRLSLDTVPEGALDYHVHLDARFDVTGVNTAFVLPFDWLADVPLTIVQGDDCPHPGLPVRISSIVYDPGEAGYVVTMREDMMGGDIIVGVNMLSEYQPTMPCAKDSDGVVISNARLVINQFLVSLAGTGEINGQKMTAWGDGPEVSFQGYITNSPGSMTGSPALDDHIFKMPFKAKADEAEVRFYTDSHWPMTILDIEWEGTINKRGKRIPVGN
ncbi:putative tail tubular protein B [Rhizobium phage RHEph03]|uniref:Putative tail tubular protein B n=1 Tax=Rhizobium phage RHEph03 TaxID=1220603 RepID=L7TJI2_9CAUD|nr:putative tail tubular protein B [Rhizobium phage RHEph03]